MDEFSLSLFLSSSLSLLLDYSACIGRDTDPAFLLRSINGEPIFFLARLALLLLLHEGEYLRRAPKKEEEEKKRTIERISRLFFASNPEFFLLLPFVDGTYDK